MAPATRGVHTHCQPFPTGLHQVPERKTGGMTKANHWVCQLRRWATLVRLEGEVGEPKEAYLTLGPDSSKKRLAVTWLQAWMLQALRTPSVQMENHLAKKKRATEATNADKYQKHYVKWKKLDIEEYLLYDFIYVKL